MAALPLLHLEMDVFALGRNITSLFAKEPHFSSPASDEGVHPSKRIDTQKSWDVRVSDDGGSVGTQMFLAVRAFQSHWHGDAFSCSLGVFANAVNRFRLIQWKHGCLASTCLCPAAGVDNPAFTA